MANLWLDSIIAKSALRASEYGQLEEAAKCLYPDGLYDRAKTLFTQIAAGAEVSDRSKEIARLGLADLEMLVGDMQNAKQLYLAVQPNFSTRSESGASALILKRLGWIAGTFDDFKQAQKHLDDGFKLVVSGQSPYAHAFLEYAQAMIFFKQERYAEALAFATQCETRRWSIGDTHGVAASRVGISKISFAMGNIGRACESMNSALELFATLKNDACVAAVSTHMGALSGAILIDRAKYAGALPGCSGADGGAAIRKALKTITGMAKRTDPNPVTIFLRSGRSWPG